MVAGGFVMICVARALTLWAYDHWASPQDLLQVRYRLRLKTLLAGLLVFLVVFFIKYLISVLSGVSYFPQLFITWEFFAQWYGLFWGITNTFLQWIYYVLEGVLMIFLVDVFQTIGELKTQSYNIPWGGIGLALSWGLSHYFSKGPFTIFLSVAVGLVMGILYLRDHKRIWLPLIFWISFLTT